MLLFQKAVRMIRIEYRETVTSTNDVAKERDEAGLLVLADVQTRGRGQRGNAWESEPGRNLTFSLIMRPEFLPAAEQFYVSEAASLAVADALETYDVPARIKWPNDIYIGDRKVCGILIEHDLLGDRLGKSVLGIGINIGQRVFLSDAPNPTSLALETGTDPDRMEVLGRFCEAFTDYYGRLEAGDVDFLDRCYRQRLYRGEGFYPYKDAGGRFLARIAEVRPTGELVLERQDGTRKAYLFKEVSFLL